MPIGDFFGLGLGEYFVYQSALTAVAPIKALNAYFKMPFASAARITVSNEGLAPTRSLYFAVDYVDAGRQFPRDWAVSTRSIGRPLRARRVESDGKNLDWKR